MTAARGITASNPVAGSAALDRSMIVHSRSLSARTSPARQVPSAHSSFTKLRGASEASAFATSGINCGLDSRIVGDAVGNEVNATVETPSITPSRAYEVGVHKIDAVITLALDTTAIHRNDDACSSRNGAQRLKCTQEESSRRSIRNTVIAGKSGDTV
ncbi:MAG: hypothetical protein DWI12_05690 [Planctomycetota bacterium]|nr:MAG: hypothetical protein DWI12_05690 [Planctomycetota bacterium]